MMKNGAHADKAGHHAAKHGEHHDKTMAASCPMKSKDDAKTAVATGAEPAAAAEKTSCSCPCCAGKAEKKADPAV
jgi:hypothetical protein